MTLRIALVLVAALTLAACSGGESDEMTEDSLRANAQAYNDKVFDGDFRSAYGYLHPDYKAKCDLGQYLGIYALGAMFLGDTDVKLDDLDAEVTDVRMRDDRATVETVTYLDGEVFDANPDDQIWVFTDGKWLLTTNEKDPCAAFSTE